MRIEKLHLENFGRFSDHRLDLAEGFNVIYGENEDGKSTIMAFIQMMFYGYSGRTRDLAGHLRRKYRPWQGGDMKGKVWFEAGGRRYRLERVFGQSNSTDQVSLWDESLGERLKLSSGNDPGRAFFGLVEEAFARSVFIRQGGSQISSIASGDELTQRLLNLVTTGSEETSYRDALQRITDAAEELVSKSGKIGRLAATRQEIEALRQLRSQAEADEAHKQKDQAELTVLAKARDEVRESVRQAGLQIRYGQIRQEMQRWQEILDRTREIAELQTQLDARRLPLTGPDGPVDETWLGQAETLLVRYQASAAAVLRVEEEASRLESELAELAAAAPRRIPAEDLTKIRQGEARLLEMAEDSRQVKVNLGELQRHLDQSETRARLAGVHQEARQRLAELEETARQCRADREEASRASQRSEELIRQAEQTQARLEAEREMIGQQLRAASSRLEQERGQAEEQSERTGRNLLQRRKALEEAASRQSLLRWLLFPAGAIAGLAAVYFGLFRDPVYFIGLAITLITALGALRDPLQGRREQLAEETAQLTQRQESERRRCQMLEAELADLERRDQDTGIQWAEQQDRTRELRQTDRALTAALDEQTSRLQEAELAALRQQDLCQSLADDLAELDVALKADPVQGTRFNLLEIKQELKVLEEAIRSLQAEQQDILADHDCPDAEAMTDRYYAFATWQGEHQKMAAALSRLKEDLDGATTTAGQAERELLAHLSRYQPIADPAEVPDLLNAVETRLAAVRNLELQLQTMRRSLSPEDARRSPEELQDHLAALNAQAAAMPPEDLAAPAGAGTDPEETLQRLREELSANDQELAARQARILEKYRQRPNLSQIDYRLELLRRKEAYQEMVWNALKTAQRVMGESFEELQQSFGPLLNDATAEILAELTLGKYRQVRVSRSLEVAVEDPESQSLYEWGFLSGGTIDQTYLALRLAMADLIAAGGEPLPLFLDDVFTQYDDSRTQAGLEHLLRQSEGASPRQTVLFTCHRRIRDWAAAKPAASVRDLG